MALSKALFTVVCCNVAIVLSTIFTYLLEKKAAASTPVEVQASKKTASPKASTRTSARLSSRKEAKKSD